MTVQVHFLAFSSTFYINTLFETEVQGNLEMSFLLHLQEKTQRSKGFTAQSILLLLTWLWDVMSRLIGLAVVWPDSDSWLLSSNQGSSACHLRNIVSDLTKL